MISQVKTRKEIADQYGVDVKTLIKWCEKEGVQLEKRSRLLPKVVKEIYERLGSPEFNRNSR